MKKVIVLLLVLVIVSFVPASPEPQGRIHELEARVLSLEHEIETRVESLEVEVACLESYVNFILSEAYVDWLLSQIQ